MQSTKASKVGENFTQRLHSVLWQYFSGIFGSQAESKLWLLVERWGLLEWGSWGVEDRVFLGEQYSTSKLRTDSKAELGSENKQRVRQWVRGSKWVFGAWRILDAKFVGSNLVAKGKEKISDLAMLMKRRYCRGEDEDRVFIPMPSSQSESSEYKGRSHSKKLCECIYQWTGNKLYPNSKRKIHSTRSSVEYKEFYQQISRCTIHIEKCERRAKHALAANLRQDKCATCILEKGTQTTTCYR